MTLIKVRQSLFLFSKEIHYRAIYSQNEKILGLIVSFCATIVDDGDDDDDADGRREIVIPEAQLTLFR